MNVGSPGTTPHPHDRIFYDCTGFPNDDEIDEWLNYFAYTFSLSRAEAICWYIRWRADGSDLSELPGGVVVPVSGGPGTELKKLLDSMGVQPTSSCDCAARIDQMNRWGAAGCRKQRSEILAWLKESYDEAAVTTKLKAGILALTSGLPLTLEGLLDEAIRRTASGSTPAITAAAGSPEPSPRSAAP